MCWKGVVVAEVVVFHHCHPHQQYESEYCGRPIAGMYPIHNTQYTQHTHTDSMIQWALGQLYVVDCPIVPRCAGLKLYLYLWPSAAATSGYRLPVVRATAYPWPTLPSTGTGTSGFPFLHPRGNKMGKSSPGLQARLDSLCYPLG
jgi:hypothetical protein